VDTAVNADRPLANQVVVKETAEKSPPVEAPIAKKQPVVEVYKPRSRASVPREDSTPQVIARDPSEGFGRYTRPR
jgi:hypothetical protein